MKSLLTQSATAAAVTALLTLGAGGAWAQSSMSSPSGTPSTHSAAPNGSAGTTNDHSSADNSGGSSSSATPMKNPLSSEDISQIDGTSVAGSDGSSIGKVSTVLMNPSTKRVDRLVVAEGGVLGVGAHDVALPVDDFRWDAKNHNFIIQKTADDLKAMPAWQQPQLAENPNANAANSGVAAGTTAGAPAGAVSAPVIPSTANSANH